MTEAEADAAVTADAFRDRIWRTGGLHGRQVAARRATRLHRRQMRAMDLDARMIGAPGALMISTRTVLLAIAMFLGLLVITRPRSTRRRACRWSSSPSTPSSTARWCASTSTAAG
jgi:hypothetical protein